MWEVQRNDVPEVKGSPPPGLISATAAAGDLREELARTEVHKHVH